MLFPGYPLDFLFGRITGKQKYVALSQQLHGDASFMRIIPEIGQHNFGRVLCIVRKDLRAGCTISYERENQDPAFLVPINDVGKYQLHLEIVLFPIRIFRNAISNEDAL
ncbi:hypothetical protein NPIL_472321 [Nephila pilipes]|uniref:Uncharacterized protein n=1 Tax=Nephila pilipes TaxID=299642 RepID=A0A8X6MT01_NEPPI|nr:hypothetical protein NPIL_472321 [Nephila pilipes]